MLASCCEYDLYCRQDASWKLRLFGHTCRYLYTKKSYTWPVLVPVLPTLPVDGATGPLAACKFVFCILKTLLDLVAGT